MSDAGSPDAPTLPPVAAAGGLKKKRNFKGLKLHGDGAGSVTGSTLSLAGDGAPGSATSTTGGAPTQHAKPMLPSDVVETLAAKLQQLAVTDDSNSTSSVALQSSDFDELGELGHGNGGTVKKVLHRPSGRVMARKNLFIDRGPNKIHDVEVEQLKKQVFLELQVLRSCHSPYIVSFYGAFVHDGEIFICMEHMDLGSLDYIYRKCGAIEEPVMGKITVAVLEGLIYLYHKHRIIHRDVKPNNILLNTKGEIKLCDFGVSGEAVNSVVKTFVGTSGYMSPERIKGQTYSVQSDVWSLGISLMELAIGRFPFPPNEGERNLAVIELLDYIVNEDVPPLPPGQFSKAFEDFLHVCLIKDPRKRPTPAQLFNHAFVVTARDDASTDLVAWCTRIKDQATK
ncbi:STE/STE7/MEK1 protein kinase [Allomyces macrogynus ATCC 38327]|uniref:STE/STE7/MEK1 protein kinase n=1 Tax=Allomyces macrogynus (strain ATCC 38327) TaxID=578462 RepID=A0A0L0T9L3_ALLM3|nr:STE/STE7/MEK1 protein kinase [Allomyces macrogynus ATCC 38327]|eukprot:KNE71442.1 STE/STE7/MEK1 protein kinase [Allomyces macrogynus ATCC 38327]